MYLYVGLPKSYESTEKNKKGRNVKKPFVFVWKIGGTSQEFIILLLKIGGSFPSKIEDISKFEQHGSHGGTSTA